jgi:CDP-diglyceride synthetase
VKKQVLSVFVWTFVGALAYLFGGWLKHTPQEDFSGKKALETLVIALLVTLISIAFNIPPVQALAQLEQWTAALIQFATSTGLIAVIDFWVKALWRRRTQQPQTGA